MMLLRMAWRNLWRNPRRTLITAASVFFAVVLATFMSSVQQGVWDNMIDNLVSLQTGQLRVERSNYRDEQVLENGFEASEALLASLKSISGISDAHPRLEGIVLASHTRYRETDGLREDRTRIGLVQGLDSTDMALRQERLVAGHMPRFQPSGSENLRLEEHQAAAKRHIGQALLGQELAEYLHAGLGDTVVLLGQGYRGAVAAQLSVIVGLVDLGNPDLNRATVYLPLPDAQHLFAAEGLWTGIVLEPEAYRNLDGLSEAALAVATQHTPLAQNTAAQQSSFPSGQSAVAKQGPKELAWAAPTWADMLPEIKQAREADEGGSLLMLFILYLLIGFGILGTILMMTLERRYEFGVLVAVGMRRSRLAAMVLIEGCCVSMLGALSGLAASIPFIHYMAAHPIPLQGSLATAYEEYGFDPVFAFSTAPDIFWSQFLTVAIISLVVSVYPLYRIGQLEPVEAMRAG